MAFFQSAVGTLQTLVIALGAGLGIWGASLITARFISALGDASVRSETELEFTCADTVFKVKAKVLKEKGWRDIQEWIMGSNAERADSENDEEEQSGNADLLAYIAALTKGSSYPLQDPKLEEGKTTPKKHFTEDTLLSAMEKAGSDETPDEAERKGLGTPATRAGIIEKLVRIGFIERKGDKKTKYLVPTHKGEMLITVIPEAIQSASMTAEWEQKLLEVEKESYSADQFMDEIESMVRELVDTYEIVQDAEVLMKPAYAPLGKCPHCGADVIEKSKGFFCENKDCKFALWKDNRFFDSLSKKLTKQVAEQLLSRGRAKLKKCRSVKMGKTYDTTVVLSVSDNGAPQFTLDFTKGAK